ncbi:MAG: hypothetical protein ACHQFX_10315 [Chitinophagales bacterium]
MKFLTLMLLFFYSLSGFAQTDCKTIGDAVFVSGKAELTLFADSLSVQKLDIKRKRKDIPRFIRKTMKCLMGDFRIADAGKNFNSSDVVRNNTPQRRIKFLGINEKYVILAFEQGGKAKNDHFALFETAGKTIRRYWTGYDIMMGEITKENLMNHLYFAVNNK